ncbi:unnamed protein product, partial [Porites lobata]
LGYCPGSWKQFKSYCYIVISNNTTWHQAQSYCERWGGELVKINSFDENEFVLKLVHSRAPSLKQIWIGLNWNPSVNNFIWSDNSVPFYKFWAPGEPSGKSREPCSNMWIARTYLPYEASGYWNDRPCGIVSGYPCGFVCKKLP